MKPRSADTDEALVSVVIPCFEYEHFLEGAVRSVLDQVGVLVEVVIVDDASTDGSAALATRLAASDPRVTTLVHTDNRGPVDTFNDGLAYARGDYLVRLDADDMLTPGSLVRSVAVMQALPDVGLVYGHPIHVTGDEFPEARTVPTRWTVWAGKEWLADRCRNGLNVITSPEVLMRKSVVDEVGGQMPLAHTHDMEMWFRIAAFSDVAYIQGVDQAWHRDHPRSLSSREVDPLRDLHERKAAFDTLFDGKASALAAVDDLRSAAMTAVLESGISLASQQFDRRAVNRELVDRCVEFVVASGDDPTRLRGWSSLQRRIRRGEGSATRPSYVIERVGRRARSELRWRKWHRNGVF